MIRLNSFNIRSKNLETISKSIYTSHIPVWCSHLILFLVIYCHHRSFISVSFSLYHIWNIRSGKGGMVVNFTTFLLYKKENFHVGVFSDVEKQQKHCAHITNYDSKTYIPLKKNLVYLRFIT